MDLIREVNILLIVINYLRSIPCVTEHSSLVAFLFGKLPRYFINLLASRRVFKIML
jgi:hypothetical protein